MWCVFYIDDFLATYSPQKSHGASMSKLLSSKYKVSNESAPPSSSSPPPPLSSSSSSFAMKTNSMSDCTPISKYWSKEKETASTASTDSSNPITYYQQQSNYLEGGVTITGKAPSKTERKSHRKELAKERKNLMKEVKEDSAESSPSAKTKSKEKDDEKSAPSPKTKHKKEKDSEKPVPDQKANRIREETKKSSANRKVKSSQEESEKSSLSRVTKRTHCSDVSKNGSEGKKRRLKEPVRNRWSWDVHLRKFFSQTRVLCTSDLEALTHSFQVTYGKPLASETTLTEVQKSCLATCVFCFILNDSTNTFQPSQTVHADIVNHTYPIAFYFTLFLPDGASSFVLPLAGDTDMGISEVVMFQVVHFFRTFFSLPRLLKITFGFQRFLRLLDFYVQRHGGDCLLNADFCSRSCMDVLLLAWILDSDYQGILEDRNHSDSTHSDTPEIDFARLQAPYRTFESVWGVVTKEVLDSNSVWTNEFPETYLQSLVRGVKQMHVCIGILN